MNDIDIGLALLVKHKKPGQTLTKKDIADVCNCTASAIYQIEAKAINKLKRKRRMRELHSET